MPLDIARWNISAAYSAVHVRGDRAQRVGDLARLHRRQLLGVLERHRTDGRLAFEGELELGDVVFAHTGEPVESLGRVRGDARAGHRGQAAIREERRARERVRSAAGPSHGYEGAGADLIEDRDDVGDGIGDGTPRMRRRRGVAGTRVRDGAEPALRRGVEQKRPGRRGGRGAVVEEKR